MNDSTVHASNCGRSVFVDMLCIDTTTQPVGYLAQQFKTAVTSCKARGWTVVGCVMNKAVAELPGMEQIKVGDKIGTDFALLRCATDVANLLMQEVLMSSNVASGGPAPKSPFDDWRRDVESVRDICYFVNRNPRLRATLKSIMLDIPRFKLPRVLMPLTRRCTRARSVVFMLVRFLSIADQLTYLFNAKHGDKASKCCDSEVRHRVKEFGDVLHGGTLQSSARDIIAWAAPVYAFEAWADGDRGSCFLETCTKWEGMAEASWDTCV